MSNNDLAPTLSILPDTSDGRGFSYSLPSAIVEKLSVVRDVHIASIEPGAIRGNHFHERKTEIITISYASACSFVWDEGEGTEVHHKKFVGHGSVSVVVPPGSSHAVQNTGDEPLFLVVMSDATYDPSAPDAVRRIVIHVE